MELKKEKETLDLSMSDSLLAADADTSLGADAVAATTVSPPTGAKAFDQGAGSPFGAVTATAAADDQGRLGTDAAEAITGVDAPATFSLEAVAKHNTSASCWMVIDGGVYDVTDFLNAHPGGSQALVNEAGGDVSDVFWAGDTTYHQRDASSVSFFLLVIFEWLLPHRLTLDDLVL
jgi:predicted heme/steroid binding protein